MQWLGFNQLITLKSDPAFRGYAWGRITDDKGMEQVMVSIAKPGKTKFHVCQQVAVPEADIEPVKG